MTLGVDVFLFVVVAATVAMIFVSELRGEGILSWRASEERGRGPQPGPRSSGAPFDWELDG